MARSKHNPDRFTIFMKEGGVVEGTRIASRDVLDEKTGAVTATIHTVRLDDGRVIETQRRSFELTATASSATPKKK